MEEDEYNVPRADLKSRARTNRSALSRSHVPARQMTLRVLSNATTDEPSGYIGALDSMLNAMRQVGVATRLNHRLVAVYDAPEGGEGDMQLMWSDGSRTICSSVMLNIPRPALMNLKPDSITFRRVSPRKAELLRCNESADYASEVVKVYSIYQEPWWHTWLGISGGTYYPADSPTGPQLFIRYHDGPIHCESPGGQCSGALLVEYTGRACDLSRFCRLPNSTKSFADISLDEGWKKWKSTVRWQNAFYLDSISLDSNEHILTGDSPLATALHERLLEVHSQQLRSKGIDPLSVPQPSAVVVGVWPKYYSVESNAVPMPTQPIQSSRCLNGISLPDYSAQVRKPIEDRRLYVANNDFWFVDFSYDCCGGWWAEIPLRTAESVLYEH
eukprot:4724960-Prymnesium_polylepis.2